MVSISTVLPTAALVSLVAAGAAPILSDSPANAAYKATFNKGGVTGQVSFTTDQGGYVKVSVNLSNLPNYGGPFLYHVHQKPVPSNGNCTATLGHLNPYNGSETATTPATKEVGDLSGKHGEINGTSLSTTYIDQYLSLNPSNPAFVGGLSVVVHLHNLTRIACANITMDSPVVNAADNMFSKLSIPLAAGAAALLL